MFSLGKDGMPYEIAGVPPDRFSATGQVWGNPTYNWDHMRKDGYVWWLARLRRSFKLYDRVRLDHFLGFHNYFAIPAGGTGADGTWMPGPGIELFQRAFEEFGPLPLIAEDLGILTPGVRALLASCGFFGMDVLEFADYDIREQIWPHNEKVLYTSTHDTSTLVGFCQRSFCSNGDEQGARYLAGEIMRHALDSPATLVMMQLQDLLCLGDDARMNVPGVAEGNQGARYLAGEIMRHALDSPATLVMMQLQDLLCLGDDARMNVPGVAEGNWSWQADEDLICDYERKIAGVLFETGRTRA